VCAAGYAMRKVEALRRQVEAAGEVVGRYAAALLDSPLPCRADGALTRCLASSAATARTRQRGLHHRVGADMPTCIA
jgi:hypothetical protein